MARSRVQKGKGKKSKFPKWAIAVVVVLVVVVAGYAIVRFSQASTSAGHSFKTVDNGKLKGGVETINKSNYGNFRIVGNNPITASWSSNSNPIYAEYDSNDKEMCATVYLYPNTIGNLTASVDTPLSPFNTLQKVRFTSGSDATLKRVCVGLGSIIPNMWYITPLKAKITQDQGKVGVQGIWVSHPF